MDYGQASLGITTLSLIWSDILQSSLFYTDMDGDWDMDYGQASLGINYSIMDMNNKMTFQLMYGQYNKNTESSHACPCRSNSFRNSLDHALQGLSAETCQSTELW
jgi:hypothetical protein